MPTLVGAVAIAGITVHVIIGIADKIYGDYLCSPQS